MGQHPLARGKKNASKLNAWLCFLDETGFSQRPPIRSTWALRGHTPLIKEPFNWQRLSGIGAIFTNPKGRVSRWFLSVHKGGIHKHQVGRFLRALKRHRHKRVILVWDRLPAHRSKHVQETIKRFRSWLKIEWLPAYAPELNPVEPLWDYIDDTSLANTPLDNLEQIRYRVIKCIKKVNRQPKIGRGFLKYTGLF